MGDVSLYIATLQHPLAETGVHTHFKTCSKFAKMSGLDSVYIISPYAVNSIIQNSAEKLIHFFGQYNIEKYILYKRHLSAVFLRRHLLSQLKINRTGRAIIYAQDPLSAKVALSLKSKYSLEVVLVIHFNISAAWEVSINQQANRNGQLFHHLLKIEHNIIPRVNRLIFVSNFMKNKILESIPKAKDVPYWVIPNMVECTPHLSSSDQLEDLITIGRLEPIKNQEFLICLLAEIHRSGHKVRLTLVGDGSTRNKLEQLASDLSIRNYVNFRGMLTNAQTLIQSHKVYVHSALMENCPIVLLEALSSGKPIFSAPVGGIPEIFDDQIEGFYLDLNDPESSARKMLTVLGNKKLLESLSVAARKRYETSFSVNVVGPQLIRAIIGSKIS